MRFILTIVLNSAISRQAKANKFSLVFWLNEIVLKSAISRQAKANKFSLVFWLNEIVGFRRLFWKNVANYALFSCFI